MSALELLRFVPKNHLSAFVGKLVSIEQPRFFTRALMHWFVKRYAVNTAEAALPLDKYKSLAKFFVRDLKCPREISETGVVSPVDGRISEFGQIDGNKLLQVKGRSYTVQALLRDDAISKHFLNGFYFSFYLSPPDYHHIHSPVDGSLTDVYHIPGSLWPVNDWAVQNIDGLFAANERVVSLIRTKSGMLAVVKIGATNVGSISLEHHSFVSNTSLFSGRRQMRHLSLDAPLALKRGQRLASFNMGSSVILLFEPGAFALDAECERGEVLYGRRLGEEVLQSEGVEL